MKKLLLLAFAAFAFAACSDETYNYFELPSSYTVDFEAAVLGDDGYIWGKSQATEQDDVDYTGKPIKSNIFFGPAYAEKDAQIYTYYTDYGHTYDTWNGFVISNHTDRTTEGFANDKSVYADSGANGSSQFAVAYYSAWTPGGMGIPQIKFPSAVVPQSIAIANTTYLYLYLQNGSIVDVTAEITGYNCGVETGKVTVDLANKAAGTIKSGWEEVDLSSLGSVTSLSFAVLSADVMCPSYLAIDELVYSK